MLSKALVEAIGGTIDPESESGVGTTFSVELADISGLDVLKRLRSEDVTRRVPVVMLTADASKSQSERARLLGASGYLAKPLDVVSFLDTVAQHVNLPDDERESRQPHSWICGFPLGCTTRVRRLLLTRPWALRRSSPTQLAS